MFIKRNFFIHNWWAILYFNFKMLPFKQAIHLPFDFYRKIRFVQLCGEIKLCSNRIKRGMIKFGSQGSDMFPRSECVISIEGNVNIKGRFAIGPGSIIVSKKGSTIEIGENVVLGARNLLFCDNYISIGKETITSWDCQFLDSDTHNIFDVDRGVYHINTKPIIIGEHSWISNNVLINKGTKVSSNTIVASKSLCNKDYSEFGSYCVLAGIPAKVVAHNKIWSR